MKTNKVDDKGFIYVTVHVTLMPILKSFSKTLNQERIILSNNRNFGGYQQMKKFHIYDANYLTKSGFVILAGEHNSKDSYNAASFFKVKEIEKKRVEQELDNLIFQLSLESENYQSYKNAKYYQNYYG